MNLLRHFILSAAIATSAISASPLTLEGIEPGGLRAAVGANTTATSLAVTGSLSLPDFEFMALEMTGLTTLDLSGVTIAPYAGDPTTLHRTASKANELPDMALLGLKISDIRLPAGITAIGSGALAGCAFKSLTIPASVDSIAPHAFADNTSLQSITIPATVKSIGNGAFKGCSSMKQVEIIAPIKVVETSLFANCENMSDITLPATVVAINPDAFNGCSSLGSINLPAALLTIGERAFYGSGLQDIDMSGCKSLTTIGKWAFAECRQLTGATFPSSLSSMGQGAFFHDGAINVSKLPDGLTEVPDFAFTGASGSLYMPMQNSNISRIGKYAMADWETMNRMVLPSTLTKIDDGAMANWNIADSINATEIKQLPELGEDVWGNADKQKIVLLVSTDMKPAFENAPQWQDFYITDIAGDSSSASAMTVEQATKLHARFNGSILHISASKDIASMQFFDANGRTFTLLATGNGMQHTVDTSAWNCPTLIVSVQFTDGTSSALKLLH